MENNYQLIDECNYYIEEINLCIDSCLNIVRQYCECRGMIEGFRRNIEWLDNCNSAPTIRYVNNVTRLLRHELISLPWKALDCDQVEHIRPARVKTTLRKKRVRGDGVRSLTRASKLFKLLLSHCDENNLNDTLEVCVIKNMSERIFGLVTKGTYMNRMIKLNEVCNDIETLISSNDFKHISASRHEGIAHSLEISSTRVNDTAGILDTLYTVNDLLSFSDNVMELIHKFDRYWRGVSHSNFKKLIETKSEFDQGFWKQLKIGLQDKMS